MCLRRRRGLGRLWQARLRNRNRWRLDDRRRLRELHASCRLRRWRRNRLRGLCHSRQRLHGWRCRGCCRCRCYERRHGLHKVRPQRGLLVVLCVEEQSPQHDHDHHQDNQCIDGGIRAAASPSARRLAGHPPSDRLSSLRHVVELPRWCGQRTALHLNVASARGFNTNRPPGSAAAARKINKKRITAGRLADSSLQWVNGKAVRSPGCRPHGAVVRS